MPGSALTYRTSMSTLTDFGKSNPFWMSAWYSGSILARSAQSQCPLS